MAFGMRARTSSVPLGALLGAVALGCAAAPTPRSLGPVSDHFDGRRFYNQGAVVEHDFGDLLRWAFNREPGPWRDRSEYPPGPPPPRRVGVGELRVTFVNHSTTLIQMDGLNVLTDPIWSDRASPVSFVGPGRARPPGVRFEDLPPIDVVLVSHNHYDHLDYATLGRIAREHKPRFVVPLGNAAILERIGIGAMELDWWSSVELVPGVRLFAVPARHFSNRSVCDRGFALWAGFALQGAAGTAYFAGDTGWGPHFAQIREKLGPIRLAILPIGAFRPQWFMAPVHISPADAVRAAQTLEAAASMAIHYGTFRLADDGQDEPVEELGRALATATPTVEFWALDFGEGRDVPALNPSRPASQ